MNKSLTSFVYLMVVLASIVIIMLGIQLSAYLINSILLAAVITVTVMPLPTKMIQRGTKPSVAFILTLLVVVVGLGLIVALIFVSIGNMSSEVLLDDVSPTAAGSGEESQTQLEQILSSTQNLLAPDQANQILAAAATFAGQVIAQSMIVLLVFIFMLSAAVTTSLSDKFEQATSSRAAKRIS